MESGNDSDNRRIEYDRGDGNVVSTWSRRHKSDEETHVVVLDLGGRSNLAIAADLDPNGELIDAEIVSSSLTAGEAEARARRWMEDNPKGIKGDGLVGGLFG